MTLIQAFRRTTLPLASYYAVALAAPLANGAAQSGSAFVRHGITVLVVPPIAIVLASVVRSTVRMRTRPADYQPIIVSSTWLVLSHLWAAGSARGQANQ